MSEAYCGLWRVNDVKAIFRSVVTKHSLPTSLVLSLDDRTKTCNPHPSNALYYNHYNVYDHHNFVIIYKACSESDGSVFSDGNSKEVSH